MSRQNSFGKYRLFCFGLCFNRFILSDRWRYGGIQRGVIYFIYCLFSCSASIVLAQTEEDETHFRLLETVVVSADRSERSLVDTGSSISVVDSTTLAIINAEHLNQVFSRTPGAWITRGNGQEHLTAIRSPVLTGAGACGAFLMAEDNIPLRATGFCNVNQLFDTHFEAADRIEIFRGPNSALYGSNAMFGGINVILPQAQSVVLPQLSFQIAENDFSRLHVRLPKTLGEQRLLLLGTATTDGGYRDNSGYDQQKISLHQQWSTADLNVVSGITLVNLEQETAGYISGHNAYQDKSLSRSNPNPEAYRDARALRAYSRWNWKFSQSELTLTPFVRNNKMDFLMHFVPWQPVEINEHKSVGMIANWRKQPSDKLEVFIGSDTELTRGGLREIQYFEAPFSRDRFPRGAHYDYQVDAKNFALSTGAHWLFWENFKVDFTARRDLVTYRYDNLLEVGSACAEGVDGCRFFRPPDKEDRFDFASYKSSLVYAFNAHSKVYTAFSSGFRAPQTTELYRLQTGQNLDQLVPARLFNQEAGFKNESDFISWQIALFRMHLDNDIFQDTERRYVSGAASLHKGIEYEIYWHRWDVLQMALSGTYAEHTYGNNPEFLEVNTLLKGNIVDSAPKTMNTLVVVWQPNSALRVDLEMIWMGSYYIDPENTLEYEGHHLANLRGSYNVSDRLTVTGGLANLFNERYAERADVSFGEERYFPGENLKASLGITLSF